MSLGSLAEHVTAIELLCSSQILSEEHREHFNFRVNSIFYPLQMGGMSLH
jgi:hypothetical protein